MLLKQLVKRVVPSSLYPSALLQRRVQKRSKSVVQGGPFTGMRYVEKTNWGAYIPKLVGSYELELHALVEQLVARAPKHIVDIGGAEGYYAVGLLRRLPAASVTVFELVAEGREVIRELAERNGVADRIEILGACDPPQLRDCLQRTGASALICDVEGYEIELLDPQRIPELGRVLMLVEAHDSVVPSCAAQLSARFEATHDVKHLQQQARSLADYRLGGLAPKLFPGWVLRYGLNEFRRPDTGWLWLEPH